MNESTTTKSPDRFYLYTYPNGRQVVFCDLGGDGFFESMAVLKSAPLDGNLRYTGDASLPDDLRTAGEEVSEERMLELSGYWLDGGTLLEETYYNLARCRPNDTYHECIQALRLLAGSALACNGKPQL